MSSRSTESTGNPPACRIAGSHKRRTGSPSSDLAGSGTQHPRGLSIAGLFACLLLTACLGIGKKEGPKTTLEAGTTGIAVTFVAPWDDFVDSLAPDFTITGDKALKHVLPTTARQDLRRLNAFSANLGLGLPQSFTSSTQSTTSEGGSQKTTSNRTREHRPGEAPAAPPSSVPGSRTAAALEGLSAEGLESDPLLQYQTASSLFQEVQFLNNQLRFAPMLQGYTPYIIRLQLNVTPFWRNLEYDVYSTISFFSGEVAQEGASTPHYPPVWTLKENASLTLPKNAFLNLYDESTEIPIEGPVIIPQGAKLILPPWVKLPKGSTLIIPEPSGSKSQAMELPWEAKLILPKGKGLASLQCPGATNCEEMTRGKTLRLPPGAKLTAKSGGELELVLSSAPKSSGIRLPFVVPLLVSDNLEGSSTQRLKDTIRELGLALNFLTAGVGGNLGLNSLNERLEKIVGTDLNSLLSVSRVNDNTIQVRLGAALQPSAEGKHAQIPRNHNISVLVLFPDPPKGWKNANPADRKVAITSRTDYRSIKNGKILGTGKPEDFYNQARKILEWVQYKSNTKINTTIYKILPSIDSGDFLEFSKIIKSKIIGSNSMATKRDLWTMFSLISRLGQPYAVANFELPLPSGPEMSDQTVLLFDDGQKMRARLSGGTGLKAGLLKATLKIKSRKTPGSVFAFPARLIAVHGSTGTQVVDLDFDSPAPWGISADWTQTVLELEQLITRPRHHLINLTPSGGLHVAHQIPPPGANPGFLLRAALQHIVSSKAPGGSAGRGQVIIHIANMNKKLIDKVDITVTNANLIGAKGDKVGPYQVIGEKISVTKDADLSLELANLSPGKTVTVKAVGMKGNKPVSKGRSLAFTVR
ncbi:MAG: hypothetical protein D6757_10585 [Alphaproteobacteria bacterium]|nr:MAG: hypothetical protein D6757_10585 [Alphaproteobacteria bacterium]